MKSTITRRLGLAGALLLFTSTAWAQIFVPGNPSCPDLGYAFGFKIEPIPVVDTTYTVYPGGDFTYIHNGDKQFDWTSTFGIDAVIVKGGPNADAYVYDPPAEAFHDEDLTPPISPNGQPYGVSHIEVCYDFNLEVSKTANTSYTRTFLWDIEKSVTPDSSQIFNGDSQEYAYTVSVDKTGFVDSGWAVSGSITIHNPAPMAATLTSVSDQLTGGINAPVNCPGGLPQALAGGATLVCTYSTALPDGSNRTNTATVGTSGDVGGGSGSADAVFGAPTTLVNDTVNITDTMQGNLGAVSDDHVFNYAIVEACSEANGSRSWNNTATIVETGQNDSASASLTCYELSVSKDADTSYARRWDWTIDKEFTIEDELPLLLSTGQSYDVPYLVTVEAVNTDENFAVSGQITIDNPNPAKSALLTDVSDELTGGISALVNCPSNTVPAGGSLVCSYSVDLPDASNRTNTAEADQQNYAYAADGTPSPSGTTSYSGNAAVVFGDPNDETDECAEITDDYVFGGGGAISLGTVCATLVDHSFSFDLTFPIVLTETDCDVEVINIAAFETNDTGATGSDQTSIPAHNADCDEEFPGGCTLTPGYWKTHSIYGPAPYDDTWAQVGEDTLFFLSGKSYYQSLWTPVKGNAYWTLARAYIAAFLNVLNGADNGDIAGALADAEALLNAYTPEQIGALKGGKAPRPQFIAVAGALDAWNNGITGPGHCSEDDSSASE